MRTILKETDPKIATGLPVVELKDTGKVNRRTTEEHIGEIGKSRK